MSPVDESKREAEVRATRRWKFKAALAHARLTAKEWCFRRDISENHLYTVLSGKRESATLLADVDAFIAKDESST